MCKTWETILFSNNKSLTKPSNWIINTTRSMLKLFETQTSVWALCLSINFSSTEVHALKWVWIHSWSGFFFLKKSINLNFYCQKVIPIVKKYSTTILALISPFNKIDSSTLLGSELDSASKISHLKKFCPHLTTRKPKPKCLELLFFRFKSKVN